MIPNRKRHLIALLMIMGFLATTSFQAQEKLEYRGPLKVGEYSGSAAYSYKLVNGDTLLEGSFLLQRSNLESLMKKEDASFMIKGAFQDNIPNGEWQLQFGEFQSGSQAEVIDYQYRVLVSGRQEEAAGSMIMGKPDGPWKIEVNQIADSKVEKNLFKSSITFENGIPQQSFRIENEGETLVGRFLRSGLAHDEWSLYADGELEAIETWVFNEGTLQKIVVQNEDGIQEMVFGNVEGAPTKTVSLNTDFLRALSLQKTDSMDFPILKGELPKLLQENAGYYQKIDDILSEMSESAFLPEFKFKLAHFPLNDYEKDVLSAIEKSAKAANQSSEILLNSTQFNILKLSDPEALFMYSVVEAIHEKYVLPLNEMTSYIDAGIVDHVSQKQLSLNLFSEGYPQKEIIIKNEKTGTTRSFLLPNAEQYHFKRNDLSAIENIAKYAAQSLDSIQSTLKSTLVQEQQAKELMGIEERLIAANNDIQVLADSLNNDTPSHIVAAIERIKNHAEKELGAYAKTEVLSDKISAAAVLTICFENLKTLGTAVKEMPGQWIEIKELYQDRVWNPFMATVMDEEVKKRITTAYRKVLIPYFFKKIEQDLDCDTAAVLRDQIQSSYQGVLELREGETKKLERKLRKEKDPIKIIKLLQEAVSAKESQE
jgi:hypothetical protein